MHLKNYHVNFARKITRLRDYYHKVASQHDAGNENAIKKVLTLGLIYRLPYHLSIFVQRR